MRSLTLIRQFPNPNPFIPFLRWRHWSFWRRNSKEKTRKKNIMARIARHLYLYVQSSSLCIISYMTKLNPITLTLTLIARKILFGQYLMPCWNTWRSKYQEECAQKQIALKVAARIRNRILVKLFQKWQRHKISLHSMRREDFAAKL